MMTTDSRYVTNNKHNIEITSTSANMARINIFNDKAGITFILNNGVLMVVGDCGDAIYRLGISSFAEISNFTFNQFAHCCVASPEGKGFKTWSQSIGQIRLSNYLKKVEVILSIDQSEDMFVALSTKADWNSFLLDSGYEIFGNDYIELMTIGVITDVRCESHYYSLKYALDSEE